MNKKNKIEELTKLLNGFLTEVLPGGTWQTYTEPKQLAEEIVKNLGLFSVSHSTTEPQYVVTVHRGESLTGNTHNTTFEINSYKEIKPDFNDKLTEILNEYCG